MSRALSAELAAARWGDGPRLYVMTGTEGGCALQRVPVPGQLWAAGAPDVVPALLAAHPGRVLAWLAAGGGAPQPAVLGAALLYEGRALFPGTLAKDGTRAAGGGPGARAGGRPARERVRVIDAADAGGTGYTVLERLGDPRPAVTVRPPGQPDAGTVPGALRLLTRALAAAARQAGGEALGPEEWLRANGYQLTGAAGMLLDGEVVAFASGVRPGGQRAAVFQLPGPALLSLAEGVIRDLCPGMSVRVCGSAVIVTGDSAARGQAGPRPPEAGQ